MSIGRWSKPPIDSVATMRLQRGASLGVDSMAAMRSSLADTMASGTASLVRQIFKTLVPDPRKLATARHVGVKGNAFLYRKIFRASE